MSRESLATLDKYVLTPASLAARLAAAPWMLYVNDETTGLPTIWGPTMMILLNTMAFILDVLPESQKKNVEELKERVIPGLVIATVFLMLGQQTVAAEKNPLILAALGAFVLPAFAGLAAGKKLQERFGAAYLLASKLFVMSAMVGFYMATKLNAVPLLLADEAYQTARALAPTVEEKAGQLARNVAAMFAAPASEAVDPSTINVAPTDQTFLLDAVTALRGSAA